MKIILNNRESEYPGDRVTVQELLKALNFTFPMIIVKINGRFVKKEDYERTAVAAGDRVDAIHLISGG